MTAGWFTTARLVMLIAIVVAVAIVAIGWRAINNMGG